MLDQILGYASVVLVALSAIFTFQIYRTTRSVAVFWLFLSFGYMAILRFIIVYFDPGYRNLMLLPFYLGLTWGMWSFLVMIRSYIKHPVSRGWLCKLREWICGE